MIIAVDGNEANVEFKVGVSIYTFKLLSYFHGHADAQTRFTIFLRNKPRIDMPKETEYFKYEVVSGKVGWSQLFLPIRLYLHFLKGIKYSVFFSPAHYIPRFCPYKTVVTIHDLSYLYFPSEFLKKDLYQLTHWTRFAIEKSIKVIAVSKTTKKDVLHEYLTPSSKVTVIYNGYESAKPSASYDQLINNHPYFLYVGTIQPRKNLKLLIAAFSHFLKKNPSFQLIIAGKKGWLSDDIEPFIRSLQIEKSVLFPGYVSTEEKNKLYKNAAAFVLPSLYEGFGIPLLEAMSYQCPTISSYKSSLPEIGGEACLYFDPQDTNDLVEKMEVIISDKKIRSDLIHRGNERVKLFSWINTGEQTLALLQSV